MTITNRMRSLSLFYCKNLMYFPLLKHSSHAVVVTSVVWCLRAKPAQVFFSNSSLTAYRKFVLTIDLSYFGKWFFFLLLLSREPLHKGNCGFSAACLNSQHHYSWASGPFLSKIRAAWTQALQYQNSRSDDQGDCPSD